MNNIPIKYIKDFQNIRKEFMENSDYRESTLSYEGVEFLVSYEINLSISSEMCSITVHSIRVKEENSPLAQVFNQYIKYLENEAEEEYSFFYFLEDKIEFQGEEEPELFVRYKACQALLNTALDLMQDIKHLGAFPTDRRIILRYISGCLSDSLMDPDLDFPKLHINKIKFKED